MCSVLGGLHVNAVVISLFVAQTADIFAMQPLEASQAPELRMVNLHPGACVLLLRPAPLRCVASAFVWLRSLYAPFSCSRDGEN